MGKVEAINLRSTIIETFQGLHIIIPNQDVLDQPLTNYTRTYVRRFDLNIGISYKDDLEQVKTVTLDVTRKLDFVKKDKPIDLYFQAFGDSSINFLRVFWIDNPDDSGYLEARSQAIISIKKAFDQHGITIPLPTRTMKFNRSDLWKVSWVDLSAVY